MRKIKPLTRTRILSKVSYRDRGFARWDIAKHVCLFLTQEDGWYDGPIWYKGWTLVVDYTTEDKRGGFIPVKITHDEAWNILASKYREWEKEDD